MPNDTALHFVRAGMLAAIRDVQDYIDARTHLGVGLDADQLRAYLMGQIIVADGFDDLSTRGES